MIAAKDLRTIARARLRDAQVLLLAKRLDGAVYLCGYSVELALKARICQTLRWAGFPETGIEFEGLQSLKTHDLELLLRPSGVGDRIKVKCVAEWSAVAGWTPEKRYQQIGQSHQNRRQIWQCAPRGFWARYDRHEFVTKGYGRDRRPKRRGR